MTTYDTLLLDLDSWDLTVDSLGNIAVASPPYALAQDVASAVKTILGEVWYNATLGVPYQNILGTLPSIEFLQNSLIDAALSVDGVVSANCILQKLEDRTITGQIEFVDENNFTGLVSI